MLQTRRLAPRHLEYLPGQLVIRIAEPAVRPNLDPTALRMTASSARQLPEAVAQPIDYLRRNAGLKKVRPLFSKQRDRVPGYRCRPTTGVGLPCSPASPRE